MSKLQVEAAKGVATGLPRVKRGNIAFFLTAALVAAGDQLTKTWARSFAEGHTIFETGLVQIVRIRNTGAAFGMFQDYSFFLTVVALIAVSAILLLVLFSWRRFAVLDSLLARTALGLVLGGTIGNLIDRLRFGYVTDFIDFRVWPLFNVADASISVGVVLLAWSLFFLAKPEKR